jgi:carboxylate-amine ligase
MADYEDFVRYADRLTRAAGVADYTFHWWKLRPHPRLGTVEVRTLDAQSSPAHVTSLVALVQALAHHEATTDPVPGPAPEILEEASYRAARGGVAAELPDGDGRLRPVLDVLEETLQLVRGSAEALGGAVEVAGLGALVAAGGGAGLQRADHQRGGMDAVLSGLLERTRDVPE